MIRLGEGEDRTSWIYIMGTGQDGDLKEDSG